MNALVKQGVTFSLAQKKAAVEAIKLNNVAEYQAIVLAELESEFGGAAETAGNTTAGAFAKLKNEVGNLAEVIGGRLLPGLSAAASALTLILTWNEQVNAATAEQTQRNIEAAGSYDDYITAQTALGESSGKAVITQEQFNVAMDGQIYVVNAAKNAIVLMTEAQFAAAQAGDTLDPIIANLRAEQELLAVSTQTVTMTEGEWKTAMGELNTLIGGQLGPELEKFRDKQGELVAKGEELRAKIGELEAKQWLTAAQKTELETMHTELGNNNEAVADNAAAHEEATRRILFGLFQQRVSMALTTGTITEDQAKAIGRISTNIALNWGIIDQATADAITVMDGALTGFTEGGITAFENKITGLAGTAIRETLIPASDELATKFGEVADDALYGKLIPAVEELDGSLGDERSLAKTIKQVTIPAFKDLIGVMKDDLARQMGKLFVDTVALEGAWSSLARAVRDAIGAMGGAPSHLPIFDSGGQWGGGSSSGGTIHPPAWGGGQAHGGDFWEAD